MSDNIEKDDEIDGLIGDFLSNNDQGSQENIGKEVTENDAPQTSPKGPGGRPSKYIPEYHNKVAHAFARAGLNEDVIASEIGISRATFFNWKNRYPEFLDALQCGKEEADDVVKASLYQRATGYDHKAVKIFMPAGSEEPVYAPYIEHVPPDVGAIKMWLTNRKPKEWKDKVDVEANVTNTNLPGATPEELDAFYEQIKKRKDSNGSDA